MPRLEVDGLVFDFPEDWEVAKYDDWAFYRRQMNRLTGTKAVDLVALPGEPPGTLWLVEVKDYASHPREKVADLALEVASKARDTLAGLFAARVHANNDEEQRFAGRASGCADMRLVLHLETASRGRRVFDERLDRPNIQQKLRGLVKAIDPHPRVVAIRNLDGLPWTVSRSPSA